MKSPGGFDKPLATRRLRETERERDRERER